MYWIEGFVLPGSALRHAKFGPRGLTVRHQYSIHRPKWQVDYRILTSRSPLIVLGLVVSRFHRPVSSVISGYSINSPRDLTRQLLISARYLAQADITGEMEDLAYDPTPGMAAHE